MINCYFDICRESEVSFAGISTWAVFKKLMRRIVLILHKHITKERAT